MPSSGLARVSPGSSETSATLPPGSPLSGASRYSREFFLCQESDGLATAQKWSVQVTARKRIRRISVALVAAALAALAFISSAAAKLTGEFTKFQHCPHDDSEIDFSVETTTLGRTGDDQRIFRQQVRELLENPFLGLNCYVGSITKTVRAPIPTEPRAIGGNRTGIQLATTRTNALSRLTFSPA